MTEFIIGGLENSAAISKIMRHQLYITINKIPMRMDVFSQLWRLEVQDQEDSMVGIW